MGKVKNYYHDEILTMDNNEPDEVEQVHPGLKCETHGTQWSEGVNSCPECNADEVEQPSHDTLTLTIPFLQMDKDGNYMDQQNDLWIWKTEYDDSTEGYYYRVTNRYSGLTFEMDTLEEAKKRWFSEWVRMHSDDLPITSLGKARCNNIEHDGYQHSRQSDCSECIREEMNK
jgi:hypothetical protein